MKKMAEEKSSLTDRIGKALNILSTNNDDEFSTDNRIEAIANLRFIKQQMESKGISINNNIDNKNISKDSTSASGDNSNFSSIQGNCIKYISKIKDLKEVQGNPNLMKLIQGLHLQIKKLGESGHNEKMEGFEGSDDSLSKLRNYEDKNIQTEKLEEEYDKINEKFEREKRVLYKQIEDKTLIINNLTKDVEELRENKNYRFIITKR